MTTIYALDLFGVIVFAVTGSLAAGKKQLDLFGVVVLALATALGGGTIRDVTLGALPVFWVCDPTYVIVAAATALATFVIVRCWELPGGVLLVADAFGLAIFTVIGAGKALSLGVSPVIAVLMGMMTGVAGGMIRDVLSGEIPLILRREVYATASLCGAVVLAALSWVFPGAAANTVVAVVVILAIRLAALKWGLSLPRFSPRESAHRDGA
jgi:uncharacterized membrane protein YeiH